MFKLDRKDASIALVLAGLALLSWVPRLKGPIDLRWDGGAYYVLGTALAQGKGYRLLNEPGEIQSTLHPPMLPVIVALHQWVLRTSDPVAVGVWLRRFYLVLFVAYAVAVYILLRAFLLSAYAFAATLVSLAHLYTIFASDLCFPEIPFALATVLFALCNLGGASHKWRWLRAPLAVTSYAFRTVGVALLAAWVAEGVCQYGPKKMLKPLAARLLVLLIPVSCWMGYITYVESGRQYESPAYEYQRADYVYTNVSYARNMRYKDPFSPELGYATWKDRARSFLRNLAMMPTSVGEAVSARAALWNLFREEFNRRAGHSLLPSWIVRLALLLLSTFILAGIGLQLLGRQYFIPFYTFFFLAAVCATPWPREFNRYLVPLAPFLSLSLFLGLRAAAGRLSTLLPASLGGIKHYLPAAVTLMIFAAQAPTLLMVYTKWHQKVAYNLNGGERIQYQLFFYHDLYRATDGGLDWLKLRVQNGEILAATDPQWSYLRTGVKTVLPPFETDPGKAQRLFDTVPVKYLIVDESRYKKYTANVVNAYPDLWRRVYADSIIEEDGVEGKFEIYERVPPGQTSVRSGE